MAQLRKTEGQPEPNKFNFNYGSSGIKLRDAFFCTADISYKITLYNDVITFYLFIYYRMLPVSREDFTLIQILLNL